MSEKLKIIAVQLSKNNYRKRKKGLNKLLMDATLTFESKMEIIECSNIDMKSSRIPCRGCNDAATEIIKKIKEKQKKGKSNN